MKTDQKRDYKWHGRFLGWGSSPAADWKILLSIFFALCLLASLYAAYIYREVAKGEDNGAEAGVVIDRELLHRTAVFYQKLKVDFDILRNTPETTPDPSL